MERQYTILELTRGITILVERDREEVPDDGDPWTHMIVEFPPLPRQVLPFLRQIDLDTDQQYNHPNKDGAIDISVVYPFPRLRSMCSLDSQSVGGITELVRPLSKIKATFLNDQLRVSVDVPADGSTARYATDSSQMRTVGNNILSVIDYTREHGVGFALFPICAIGTNDKAVKDFFEQHRDTTSAELDKAAEAALIDNAVLFVVWNEELELAKKAGINYMAHMLTEAADFASRAPQGN